MAAAAVGCADDGTGTGTGTGNGPCDEGDAAESHELGHVHWSVSWQAPSAPRLAITGRQMANCLPGFLKQPKPCSMSTAPAQQCDSKHGLNWADGVVPGAHVAACAGCVVCAATGAGVGGGGEIVGGLSAGTVAAGGDGVVESHELGHVHWSVSWQAPSAPRLAITGRQMANCLPGFLKQPKPCSMSTAPAQQCDSKHGLNWADGVVPGAHVAACAGCVVCAVCAATGVGGGGDGGSGEAATGAGLDAIAATLGGGGLVESHELGQSHSSESWQAPSAPRLVDIGRQMAYCLPRFLKHPKPCAISTAPAQHCDS